MWTCEKKYERKKMRKVQVEGLISLKFNVKMLGIGILLYFQRSELACSSLFPYLLETTQKTGLHQQCFLLPLLQNENLKLSGLDSTG